MRTRGMHSTTTFLQPTALICWLPDDLQSSSELNHEAFNIKQKRYLKNIAFEVSGQPIFYNYFLSTSYSLNAPYPMAAQAATGAAAVIIAPVAIPPPTTEPTVAIPDDIAAPPARPEAPAADANAAPVVPAVADMIVAADPPTTAEAVLAATKAVAAEPAAPTTVDFFMFIAFRCKEDIAFQ